MADGLPRGYTASVSLPRQERQAASTLVTEPNQNQGQGTKTPPLNGRSAKEFVAVLPGKIARYSCAPLTIHIYLFLTWIMF